MTHTERQAGGWASRALGVCLHVSGTWLSCVPLLWALTGLGRSPSTKSPGVGRAVGRPGVVCTEHASHGKNFRETLAVQAGSGVSL